MKVDFKPTNVWYATEGENDPASQTTYSSRENAIKSYAKKNRSNAGINSNPFWIHTGFVSKIEVDEVEFLDWTKLNLRMAGVYQLGRIEEIEKNPKVMGQLKQDLNDALMRELAAVQQTNEIQMVESEKIYPREYMQYIA